MKVKVTVKADKAGQYIPYINCQAMLCGLQELYWYIANDKEVVRALRCS